MSKKRIFVDMDNVLCDYDEAHKKALENNPDIKYPQSQYGFFFKLKPIRHSIKAFNILSKRNEFDVWIATAPSIYNPMSYTEKRAWVGKYLGLEVCNKLIIIPNKSLLIGKYLIDDIKEGKANQQDFIGELIHFGSEKFPNWTNVLYYLLKSETKPI